MKSGTRRHQPWLEDFIVFLFLMSFQNSHAVANAPLPSRTSPTTFGLQQQPIPPVTPAKNLNADKVALGEALFNDARLSRDNAMSCASCHLLGDNGASHQSHTPGRNGVELAVNTPTVFNSSLNHQQFWDGRAMDLQQQINFVVENKKEFDTSWPVIIKKLEQDKDYIETFDKLYDNHISPDNVRDAIATFEHSLMTVNSRFDQYLQGDADAINADEKKGYQLFRAYGCIACHQGSNVGGNLFMKVGIFGDYFADRGNQSKADLGRYNLTGDAADRHVFRVPGLRLAALTAPYFHDGSIKTLDEAVKLMAKYQLGREMPDQDIKYIVTFLKTLPGEYKGLPLMAGHAPQKQNKAP